MARINWLRGAQLGPNVTGVQGVADFFRACCGAFRAGRPRVRGRRLLRGRCRPLRTAYCWTVSVDLTGRFLAHYLVQEVIGRGGMSVVYRALDQRLERAVALKVMTESLSGDAEFRARFFGEARAASAIDHLNVVPLYDVGEADGWLYIAMRLVDGTDLAKELSSGPMPLSRVLALLGQVAAALDSMHARGLVHLDVKPANVLITRNESAGNEHVYLADFGLSRRGATGHRTSSGDFLGSPTYASPEHLRGADVTPGSDEYSFACMLFAALAGRPPYLGDVRTVITGHLTGLVPSLAGLTGLPSAVDLVIARGLAADPSARYPGIADLLQAIRAAVLSGAGEAPLALTGSIARGGPVRFGDVQPIDRPLDPGLGAVERDPGPGAVKRSTAPARRPPPAPGPDAVPPGSVPRRPTSHRAARSRPKWPWIVGLAVVVSAFGAYR